MNSKRPSTEIRNAMRKRIVLHSGGDTLVLHEGKLATKFGVSRTPIRQVLQALAAEGLVEVRSGVGSIATPLDPERHDKDVRALSALLLGCARCAENQDVGRVLAELNVVKSFFDLQAAPALDDSYFENATRFIGSLTLLVNDKILEDALVACYWRFIRRRLAHNAASADKATSEFKSIVNDAIYGAETGQAERVFMMVSGSLETLQQPS